MAVFLLNFVQIIEEDQVVLERREAAHEWESESKNKESVWCGIR